MTFRRKLLLGFSFMILPALFIRAEAIHTNTLERAALEDLGQHMARNRSYAELEDAMFNQTETVWRFLTGMDPTARQEFRLNGDVIDYWQQRWRSELRPDEMGLADTARAIHMQIEAVAGHVFALYDSGQHVAAYHLAQRELRDRLLPILAGVNRDIDRRVREASVRGAYARLTDILAAERRAQLAILVVALGAGLLTAWLISRGLARPISRCSRAMSVAETGDLTFPIDVQSSDEIGDLARAFARMTDHIPAVPHRHDPAEHRARRRQSPARARPGPVGAVGATGVDRRNVGGGRSRHQETRSPVFGQPRSSRFATPSPAHRANTSRPIIDEVDRLDKRVSHLLSFSRPRRFTRCRRVSHG